MTFCLLRRSSVELLLYALQFSLWHSHFLLKLAHFLLRLGNLGLPVLLLKRLGDIVAPLLDVSLAHLLDVKVIRFQMARQTFKLLFCALLAVTD